MMKKNNLSFLVGAFYFFYFAMVGVYVIFMPKVLNDLAYTPVEIGAIYTASPLMRFLLPFVFKYFIKLTHKVFVISLLSVTFISLSFFVTIDNFWLFLPINLLYGAAMGVALPFVETISLQHIGKERYGKVRLWGSIGFALIAFVLGKVLNGAFIALVFFFITTLFTTLLGLFLAQFEKESKQDHSSDDKSFSLLKYWGFWVSIFLLQFSFGGFYNFFTIYETSNGLALDVVSYLWIFGVVCEIIMLQFQGPILQKYPLLLLLEITTFSAVLRWIIVALFPQNLWLILLAQASHALNFALYYTAAIAYVYRLYIQKKLAQQFFLGISFGLGGALGAIVSGIIYKYSPNGLFLFEAFIALLSFVFLFIHQKRVKNAKV